jgi:hypothetical protein
MTVDSILRHTTKVLKQTNNVIWQNIHISITIQIWGDVRFQTKGEHVEWYEIFKEGSVRTYVYTTNVKVELEMGRNGKMAKIMVRNFI